MRTIAAAALAASLAVAGSANAATNLVTNGSFESGFFGWTYNGSGADVGPGGHPAVIIPYNSGATYPGGAFGEPIPPDDSASASPDAVGNAAVYFVADASEETLSQTVHLLPGLYTIGFSVYVPLNGFNNSGDASFSAKIAGVDLASFTVDGSTAKDWVHYAGVANIVAEGDYLTSFTYNSGAAPAGDFVVDRAYIVAGNAIPEPGTWALMILGFGAAGAALRRSRRVALAA